MVGGHDVRVVLIMSLHRNICQCLQLRILLQSKDSFTLTQTSTARTMSTTSPCETLISVPILDGPSSTTVKLFDFYPGADIILCSSKYHEFRVPKRYILNSSPVLTKLILTSSNSHDTAPIVHLNENCTVLSGLLTFIFPVSPALPPTAEQTMELLSVAHKYEMDSVVTHIRDHISRQDPPFVRPENALCVYSLAQKYRLREEALQAARMSLTSTMTIEDLDDKLDIMPGSFLHELWKYHQRVRGSLMLDLIEFRRSGARGTLKGLHCNKTSSFGYPSWLDDYFELMAKSPAAFDLTRFHMTLLRHSAAGSFSSGCSHCASIPIETIQLFWAALTAVVHKSFKSVSNDDPTMLTHLLTFFYRPKQIYRLWKKNRRLKGTLNQRRRPHLHQKISTCVTRM
jgi:hypothetical protein